MASRDGKMHGFNWNPLVHARVSVFPLRSVVSPQVYPKWHYSTVTWVIMATVILCLQGTNANTHGEKGYVTTEVECELWRKNAKATPIYNCSTHKYIHIYRNLEPPNMDKLLKHSVHSFCHFLSQWRNNSRTPYPTLKLRVAQIKW